MLALFPETIHTSAEERAIVAPFEKLACPRQVSLKLAELIFEVAAYSAFGGFSIYFVTSVWHPKSQQSSLYVKAFSVVWILLIIYILIGNAVAFIRERKLLADGEVTLGRIFHVRGGRNRRIEFAFQDRAGLTIAAKAAFRYPMLV